MKDKVALYFDAAAENWDKKNAPDPAILEKIADIAGISEEKTILDAGCGTGVMLPVFFGRNAGKITAVDISEKMLRAAAEKYPGKNVSFVCCDVADYPVGEEFDCVLTHNAFPHFLRQREAIEKLKALTRSGGTLTVAHSVSREAVLRSHRNIPEISAALPEAEETAAMFGDGFTDFTILSDDRCYIVSAVKK